MRKLIYLAFCAVLAIGAGCAITDYALITDNDQVSNGQGTGIVNTNGKAHIVESIKAAWLLSDGRSEEWLTFVDQKANGDRTLTSYANISSPGEPTFHDDLYCNPDWNGCAAWTAADPEVGDTSSFDGTYNPNCTVGGWGSLVATGFRSGECGRALTFTDLPGEIELMNMGQYGEAFGMNGLFYRVDQNTTTVIVNGEVLRLVPINVFWSPRDRAAAIDISNPTVLHVFTDLDRIVDKGDIVSATVIYNGIELVNGDAFAKVASPRALASRLGY